MPERIKKKVSATIDKVKRTELERMDRLLDRWWMRVIVIAMISLVIAMLTTMTVQHLPDEFEAGTIATRDIKADRNYEILDEEATNAAREGAATAVLTVYDFDEGRAGQVTKRIEAAFESAQSELEQLRGQQKRGRKHPKPLTREEDAQLRKQFQEQLGATVTDDEWRAFMNESFSARTGNAVSYLVQMSMAKPIIAERAGMADEKERGIIVLPVGVEDERKKDAEVRDWRVEDLATIRSAEEARTHLQTIKLKRDSFAYEGTPKAVVSLAQAMIEPNLSLNRAETDRRREQAQNNVKASIIKIQAGEMIIRNGSRYEKSHIKVLGGIQREMKRGAFSREFFGTWLLAVLILVIPFILARRFMWRFHPSRLDYVLMGAVGLAVLGFMRAMIVVLPTIRETFFSDVPPSALNYIIPVAGGAMLIRMLLSVEVTLVFALVMSMCAALFVQADLQFATFAMLSSLAAMIAITNVDRRTLIMRAGLITGLANALIVMAIRFMGMATVAEVVSASGLMWSLVFAFIGGLGSAILVMIAAPIIESLMNYTTDIKLLELANLNHPLLRELIVSAPGTYHHAHLVGILGEAAAEAIGANALLVRVGAYYHDIGKMSKPPYFIENTRNGENKHEKLTPHMSALIVQAHVKDGIDMGQTARLPKVIIDMIPQHHGTRMISFFYEKAKSQEDPDRQKIDPKDFRYPGPKPQTREAAVLMLSDVVEAQVRSLKEKNPARIEQTVRKIIDDVFREAQLDECELTLKDLNDIHKAFVRILLGIYHQRIEYPDKEKGEASRENLGSGIDAEQEVSVADENGPEKAGARAKGGSKGAEPDAGRRS